MPKFEIPYNYVTIEGNIGAGKTSFCRMLAQEYPSTLVLEQFNDNPFLPLFYKDPERYAFTLELFFMTERFKQMQHAQTTDIFQQLILSDYFFTKTLLFARKNLVEEEYKLFQQLFQVLVKSIPQPELLVYFHRSTDILIKNIRKRNRGFEQDITEDYLLGIQHAYFEYFRSILSFPIVIVDLNEIDFVQNRQHYEELKLLLTKQYQPGVHRFSLFV